MSEDSFGQSTRKSNDNNGPRRPVHLISEVEQSSCDLFRRQSEDGGTIEEQFLSSWYTAIQRVCVCVCVHTFGDGYIALYIITDSDFLPFYFAIKFETESVV